MAQPEHRRLETRLIVRGSSRPRTELAAVTRRHAGLGPRRGLLPDLPGPVRRERARPQAGRRSSRGTRRRRSTASRAATCSGIVEQLDYLQDLGVTAIYLTPIFQLGLEPPLPHVRLLPGRPAARRRRRAARAARRRPRPRDAGRPRWRLQPHRPRLLAVPPHPRDRGGVAVSRTGSTSTDARLERAGRCSPIRRPGRAAGPSSATRPGGACRPCPSSTRTNPEVREYLLSVAEHWLRFGIDGWRLDVPAEIDDPPFWQEFRRRCRAVRPDAYLVGEIWRIAPEWLRGDRFDALMNYPLAEAILGFAGGASLDMAIVAAHHEYRLWVRPLDGPAFADTGHGAASASTTRTSSRSSSTCSARTTLRGCGRSSAATRGAPGWRCSSRRRCPAPRASTTATRSGSRAATIRTAAARFPWDEGALGTGAARVGPGAAPPAPAPSRRCATGRCGSPAPAAAAVAFERGDGAVALRRRGQRRRRRRRLDLRLERRRSTAAGGSSRSSCPGLGGIDGRRRSSDGAAALDLRPRSGSVLRIR